MISSHDFNLATGILHRISKPNIQTPFHGQFSSEYKDQGLITTALKIIHKSVQEGTSVQQKELSRFRHEIVDLNALLSKKHLADRVRQSLNLEIGDEAQRLEGMQIAVPLTQFEKMVEIATLIPRIALSIITDIVLLPVGVILVLCMLAKPNFDPTQPKTNVVPILLLHSSGFNESEWVFGRLFLKKDSYGSVFSVNYDGLVTNDPNKGIDDYAVDKVRDKILQIKKLTGQDRIILIGHSMGGMIAGHYAEYYAKQDKMNVEHVMSISSPWRGSPAISRFLAGPNLAKRYKNMSPKSRFRKDLVAQALASERAGRRKYYSIGSETDPLVPGFTSILTEDPRRQRRFTYMGHGDIVLSPRAWGKVCSWLDGIYAHEPVAMSERQVEGVANQAC